MTQPHFAAWLSSSYFHQLSTPVIHCPSSLLPGFQPSAFLSRSTSLSEDTRSPLTSRRSKLPCQHGHLRRPRARSRRLPPPRTRQAQRRARTPRRRRSSSRTPPPPPSPLRRPKKAPFPRPQAIILVRIRGRQASAQLATTIPRPDYISRREPISRATSTACQGE
jgi:hypothetical protein